MKKFVLMHFGFETPTQEIMAGWNRWFELIADKTVENIGFSAGKEITHTGTADLPFDGEAITGITILEAESIDEAERIAKECPFITGIRVYEVRSM
jgi:hypothetical protein